MSGAATTFVANKPWLSQGDIFAAVPILRLGITTTPEVKVETGYALLVSHACSIDKKSSSGKSRLEYLSFLPIHDVKSLPTERQANIRNAAGNLRPYEAMYLGELPFGESYVALVEPYTLPALLFQTDLRTFTDAQTGEGADDRVVPTFHDTRVGVLDADALRLFQRKWMVQWTRLLPDEA